MQGLQKEKKVTIHRVSLWKKRLLVRAKDKGKSLKKGLRRLGTLLLLKHELQWAEVEGFRNWGGVRGGNKTLHVERQWG